MAIQLVTNAGVKQVGVQYASGGSPTVTLPNPTTAGNFLVAYMQYNAASLPATPSGWSVAISKLNGSTCYGILYYQENIAGGASTYSFPTAAHATTVVMAEYSGVATSSSLDKTGSGATFSSTCSAGSVTTTQANELLIFGFGTQNTHTTSSLTAGYTMEENGGGSSAFAWLADQIVSATGTFAPSCHINSSDNWNGCQATFIAAAGGGSTTTTQTLSGTARITAQTTRTQSATARITATSSQTQSATARIQVTSSQAQSAVARITATTTRTQAAVARITSTTQRTLTAISRITATTQRTMTATAHIVAQGVTSRTLTATARITAQTQRTLTGTARLTVTTARTLASVARISIVTQRTLTAVSRVTAITQRTQLAKARITATTQRTLAALARVQITSTKTMTAVAHISAYVAALPGDIDTADSALHTVQLALSVVQAVSLADSAVHSVTVADTDTGVDAGEM